MPIEQRWHFVCPITGTDLAVESDVLPERWAHIGGEVYSPEGMYILAWRILMHPEGDYRDLLSAPFPSTVYDDWQNNPPTPPGFEVTPKAQA